MGFRHAFHALNFFREAADYVEVDDAAIVETGADASRDVSIHKRIVAAGIVFGLLGAASGVAMIVLAAKTGRNHKEEESFLLAPLIFAVMGCLLGPAAAITFVPTRFLTSPVGQRWMRLVGTESVVAARIICSIFLVLLVAIVAVFGAIAWFAL